MMKVLNHCHLFGRKMQSFNIAEFVTNNGDSTGKRFLKSNYLSLNEATGVDSESSTLETDDDIWRCTLLVMHARNE